MAFSTPYSTPAVCSTLEGVLAVLRRVREAIWHYFALMTITESHPRYSPTFTGLEEESFPDLNFC